MGYEETIRRMADDPEGLERAYQDAIQSGEEPAFERAIHEQYREASDDVLLAAWHYRFLHAATRAARRAIAWAWAVPLAALNGLVLWLLSDVERYELRVTNPITGDGYAVLPTVVLLAAPVSAIVIALFLAVVARRGWARVAAAAIGLVVAAAYVVLFYPQAGPRPFQEQYLTLMVMHLALGGWIAVGVVALARGADPANRFAFLAKSLELGVVGGLFGAAGGVFAAVTLALFQALQVELPDPVLRLLFAGGAGVIAVLATALVYDPGHEPASQSFDEGPRRVVAMLLRILLPLSALVLAIYVAMIPANYRAPFESRDVLIVYTGMLFAVMALLIGAAPLRPGEVAPRLDAWLRRSVVAVSALALVVGGYALAAIAYRASIDRLTPNRVAFIGWDVVNVIALAWLLWLLWRARRGDWHAALRRALSGAAVPYAAWTLFVILATPWLFGAEAAATAGLPERIQQIAFESPRPILLKCDGSPHIYLLDAGRKRWIRDIETLEGRGFQWRDVHFAPCDEIEAVPDGPPIPADAGAPPAPTPRPTADGG